MFNSKFFKHGILADKLLEGLPETKREILKIGNVEIAASLPEARNMRYQQDGLEESQSANAAAIAINKGTVKVSATLFVEYQILE